MNANVATSHTKPTPTPTQIKQDDSILQRVAIIVSDGSGPQLADQGTKRSDLKIIASTPQYYLVEIPLYSLPGTFTYGVYDVQNDIITSGVGSGSTAVTSGDVTYLISVDQVYFYRKGDQSITALFYAHDALASDETFASIWPPLQTKAQVVGVTASGVSINVFTAPWDTSPIYTASTTYRRILYVPSPSKSSTCRQQGSCFR